MVLAYISDDRILVRHKYWIDNRISGEGREIVSPDFFRVTTVFYIMYPCDMLFSQIFVPRNIF